MNPQSYTPCHKVRATHYQGSTSNHSEDGDPEYDHDFEEVFEKYEHGPPMKIRQEVSEECNQNANSKINLAV